MGGKGAPLAVTDSVSSLRKEIAKLKPDDSGKFFNYDGKPLPGSPTMALTEQQAMVRDMARSFAPRNCRQQRRMGSHGPIPSRGGRRHGRLGFMGMLVPEEWGGAGVDHVAYALAVEEIAAGDGSCSTIMAVHNSVGCLPILKFAARIRRDASCARWRRERCWPASV